MPLWTFLETYYENILKLKGKLFLVKPSVILNKTAVLFQNELKDSMIVTDLDSMKNVKFETQLSDTISKIIRKDLEYSQLE